MPRDPWPESGTATRKKAPVRPGQSTAMKVGRESSERFIRGSGRHSENGTLKSLKAFLIPGSHLELLHRKLQRPATANSRRSPVHNYTRFQGHLASLLGWQRHSLTPFPLRINSATTTHDLLTALHDFSIPSLGVELLRQRAACCIRRIPAALWRFHP
ncbi:uncharacterized protein BDR25DRAFT_4966 [Lindgomyces ingoldianus]|uniref:Uncharacterized protein n=1 Tax=Lindgomyces ingoldianus TaxID=673940 RepID=A0ACB6RHC6_9PLEO|nr:uncharacterized protein BDR25DRAFT_4966 [Lindgomyces ingoldianus]KAF2477876.1 hypothetical protein BDR25DRAFT_4966 [Lindgomyces ingoldianus]